MNNKEIKELKISLGKGKEIVAQLCDYDGEHPEIVICIQENGIATQDICLVRPDEYNTTDTNIETLVWGDEMDENYTHQFIISQYIEKEEN